MHGDRWWERCVLAIRIGRAHHPKVRRSSARVLACLVTRRGDAWGLPKRVIPEVEPRPNSFLAVIAHKGSALEKMLTPCHSIARMNVRKALHI